jgi:hypothetical protein
VLLIGEVCVGKVEVVVERGIGARLDVELIECVVDKDVGVMEVIRSVLCH